MGWLLVISVVPCALGLAMGSLRAILVVWLIWSVVMGITVLNDDDAWGSDFFPVALIGGYILCAVIAGIGGAVRHFVALGVERRAKWQ